jgi:hypothetical protein
MKMWQGTRAADSWHPLTCVLYLAAAKVFEAMKKRNPLWGQRERAFRLLVDNLSATQRQQLTRHGFFDVIGGETGTTYRIREGHFLNVECQLTKAPGHVDAPARVEAHRLSVLMNLHAARTSLREATRGRWAKHVLRTGAHGGKRITRIT